MRGEIYDALIIGGGPAGLTAGIYLRRAGWNAALLEKDAPGGQARLIERVENYPGFPGGVSGRVLMRRFERQAARWGLPVHRADVARLARGGPGFQMRSSDGREFRSSAVIYCAGSTFKRLGVPGESEAWGRGVRHGAFEDAPRFAGRVVGVVGGGDAAVHQALLLARHAKRVVLLHRGGRLTALDLLRRRLASRRAVQTLFYTVVERVVPGRGERLQSVEVRDLGTGRRRSLPLSALFVLIGKEPGKSPAVWKKPPAGVFTAGDARPGSFRQIAIAAGDGMRASMECERYLSGRCRS